MHTDINTLFSHLWDNYLAVTPSAKVIYSLLAKASNSEQLINDHVAFRTFNLSPIGLEKLAAHFEGLGYAAMGDYNFESKKLTAKHYQHEDLSKPKVFISELRVEEMPNSSQDIIHKMVDSVSPAAVSRADFLYSGTHWQVSKEEYETLLAESEYAAWLAAWGFRANHFTVSVNYLNKLTNLEEVNRVLKEAGIKLNQAGGEIKGGRDVCLAQSSTMADKSRVIFNDAEISVPSCFYEFAERFELENGDLYQGFVAASADKIFESTNAK